MLVPHYPKILLIEFWDSALIFALFTHELLFLQGYNKKCKNKLSVNE